MTASREIILTTLNARYMHAAFGLRYLYANLGDWQADTEIVEFSIQEQALNIAETLLRYQPKIIGFSVYIWNVQEISDIVAVIKQIAPQTIIILGGPEVGHHPDVPSVCEQADFVISGPGEKSFRDLCEQLLTGNRPEQKFIEGQATKLDELVLPYAFYNDEDIRNRLIYVEASRGCPFKCEFCLSALDKTATPFLLDPFLDEMEKLWQRGVRNFKFIDRTFNLKVTTSIRILEFFLERMSDDLYLHFEVVPDNLPDKLKDVLKRFPPQSLQFEIGIQTFDPAIQTLISRKQNNAKTCENIRWLREHTGAHLHTDLIFGLPSDTLDNFADSFDQLVALNPHEIQLGILKRLRGAPLNRHTEDYDLRYNPQPPYNILSTRDINFMQMQRVNRFARFWDMIGNSGRFINTLPIILGESPFVRFMQLSDRLYALAGQSYKIALRRLFEMLYVVMTEDLGLDAERAKAQLKLDYSRADIKGIPDYEKLPSLNKKTKQGVANKRQRQHA
ncbi:Mg-protoporphyrin IX monomethyl ester oxidative cyclase [Methylophaga thiooxydans]|uniref:Mg-protoporphyrin IX monomethyl ester oxidative cyclase n=1 Tax=Methylophaga thiooxydans TaxID=392484 RepID=A0A0A0BJD2_9GAMM|nr:B12-binding domain-containing radical SAM protein [Methylophaga thiooxydans]KGM07204.1 Mg-protoporphyrin IX monomethyl ester oxidative cyclase [Methylophaga thiooxydans]